HEVAEGDLAILAECGRKITGDRLDAVAHEHFGPIGAAAINAAGHVGHQRTQPGLALAQEFLMPDALGEVAEDADDAAVGGAAVGDVEPAAVGELQLGTAGGLAAALEDDLDPAFRVVLGARVLTALDGAAQDFLDAGAAHP